MREARAGDKPIEAAYLGDTAIKRMYAGGTLAWPPPLLGMDYSYDDGELLFAEADDSCPSCKGTGELDCPSCDGTGKLDGEPCGTCGGKGLVTCETCEGTGEAQSTDLRPGSYSYDEETGTLEINEDEEDGGE